MKNYSLLKCAGVVAKIILSVFLAFISFTVEAQVINTSPQFVNGKDTLVVYTDVKDLDASEFYKIEVKSAAHDQWVECYANITRSLYNRLEPGVPIIGNKKEHYYPSVADWSHTYANIEMSRGSLVEVRITAKNGFKIKGSDFITANAYPAQKASKPTVTNNVVHFTIDNPGQVVIDINGQMDATNTGPGYSGPAVHTVALYANPVIKKPVLGSAGVYEVKAGTEAPTDPTKYTTLYFGPGVHDIKRGFKFYSDKNYYISGDAIVYGTFYNPGPSADNVKIYGYGTLSGDHIKHPEYDPAYTDNSSSWKMISTSHSLNFRIEGISISNSPFHTINFSSGNLKTNESFVEWVKIVTWRGNGDGIGNAHVMNDTFIRTQDDCTYVKGNKSKCVFWTDVNGAIFTMAGMPKAIDRKILIENCDVIFPRHNSYTWNGGRVFARRADQSPTEAGKIVVDVTFKDIRITDPYQTLETFQLISKDGLKESGSYSGIKFINIKSVKTPVTGENRIIGWASSPWSDITFDNVVLGNKPILKMTDFAAMGPDVSNIIFISGIPVTVVSITGCPTIAMTVNATKQLSATVSPTNATNKSVNWSSSNTAVATVSSTGLVTAKAAGSATITVTTVDGAKTAVCDVNVVVPVSGVSISGCLTSSMNVNATNQLTATVVPTNATNKSVNWSSSNTAVATVSSAGLVTAKAAGSATITVTTVDGAKTAVCNLTVAASSVAVTGVTLTACPTASMSVNATQQLTATVAPTNATNKSVNWSSSNTAVATVSSAGLVTAKAAGSATITVTTVDGNKTNVCKVTVATSAPAQTPYGGVNRKIPGLIEAEHYDEGVEGSAFHDNTTKQGVLLYRADDMVDVVNRTAASNGKAVGYTLDGEWLEYKVDVTTGTYDIKLSYFCTISTAGDLKVFLGDKLLTTFTNIAAQPFSTEVAHTTIPKISIEGGMNQTLRLEVLGAKFDIDAINFSQSASTTKISSGKTTESESVDNGFRIYPNPVSNTVNFSEAVDAEFYNGSGQKVLSVKNSSKADVSTLTDGIYLVKVNNNWTTKIIIKK